MGSDSPSPQNLPSSLASPVKSTPDSVYFMPETLTHETWDDLVSSPPIDPYVACNSGLEPMTPPHGVLAGESSSPSTESPLTPYAKRRRLEEGETVDDETPLDYGLFASNTYEDTQVSETEGVGSPGVGPNASPSIYRMKVPVLKPLSPALKRITLQDWRELLCPGLKNLPPLPTEVYKIQTDYFETSHFQFDDTLVQQNSSNNGGKVIEFVCSPNNPDGNLRTNVLKGPSVSTIHDLAYYWPHFTPIPTTLNGDLMIFTLSKLTGHAGSRFGWALVKDKKIYDNMVNYMEIASLGTSKDTQLRALQLFKTILRTNGTEIFDFAYNTMRRRWTKLNDIMSPSKRFALQKIPPQFCTYFQRVRDASPAYAWVKCERKEDSDCAKVFEEAKITGRGGRTYYADASYVRLALIRGNDDFNLLLKRVSDLVSKEM